MFPFTVPDAADDTAPIWSPDDYARFARHALPAVRTWALSRLAHLYPADARLPAALADALFDPSISVQSAALRTLDAIAREPPLRAPDAAAYAPALAALGRYAARREQPARLRAEARRVHDALATPAGASAPLPAGDALRAQLATVDEAADERLETLSRALEADPAVLRGWAPAVLRGELDTAASRLAWTALGAQNTRWATALILEALPRALDAGEFTEPWDALEQLGDPAALPAVVREWRAGERRIARLGVLLAALTPEAAALPDALRREGEAAVALALENDVMVLRADDPREALTRAAAERPLLLPLRCNQCGRVYWYDVHGVYMHPDPDACAREGWDGVTLQRVLVCKRCGAEDDYALTAWAQLELTGELLRISTQGGRLRATPRVTFGVPGLWDGTVARRPSQGLRHLRALAERTPSAEAWRRVGNFAERIGRPDEAEAAWRAAIALDDNDVAAGRPLTPLPPGEVDAAHAYADYLLAQGRRDEAWPYLARAFARLPSQLGADTDPRDRVHDLLASLRNAARAEGASAVLPVRLALAWRERDRAASSPETHGALDPRRFAQWDALEAFLAGTTLVRAELVTGAGAEVTPEETQAVIAALAHASSTVGVREARVGRNDPCPCGSGRKFKKCCGK